MKHVMLALLACMLLAGAIYAQGGRGNGQGSDDFEAGKPSVSPANYGNSAESDSSDRGNSIAIAERYRTAMQKYQESIANMKEKWQGQKETALQKGKDHTEKAIDVLGNMLKVAEDNVMKEKRLSEEEKNRYLFGIRERLERLDGLSSSVGNATNVSGLIWEAKHVKDEWQEAKHTARLAIGGIGVGRMGDAVELGWKAENKTIELISKCAAAGYDVTQANAHLEQFREHLRLAEQENLMAQNAFGNSTVNTTDNTAQGYEHLRNAQREMVEAKKLVNQLKDDLKTCVLKRGHLAVGGSGWLRANGSGNAELTGNGTVDANFPGDSSSGKVTIIDRAGDAVIDVTGGNEVRDGNNSAYVKVRTFTGVESVKVSGSKITVILNGNDISLYSEGWGIAILRGNGTFEAGATGNSAIVKTGPWSKGGTAIRMGAGTEEE